MFYKDAVLIGYTAYKPPSFTEGVQLDGFGNVSGWHDLSGNGNSAVQNTVTSRPTLLQPGPNGQPSVSLDGVDDE